ETYSFPTRRSYDLVGDTRAVRENGYIYRYDGSQWKVIQEFDLSMIDDLETTIQRTANYTGIPHKEMHKREIVLELPGRFDDYNAVMTRSEEHTSELQSRFD